MIDIQLTNRQTQWLHEWLTDDYKAEKERRRWEVFLEGEQETNEVNINTLESLLKILNKHIE